MKNRSNRYVLGSAAALLILAGCGGGSDAPVAPVATTTKVSTTVIDGVISNALVCVDKSANGKCDPDETQGRTDLDGNVTLDVPNGDLNQYAIVAEVDEKAVDRDHGRAPVSYTMVAPADKTGVVSPLTTLVHQTMATTGATSAEAEKAVQAQTGITASLFQDFIKAGAPTDGSISAAAVARLVVVTTQRQSAAVALTVNTPLPDGKLITQADLDKAIQQKLLEILPALVTALSDPAVLAAGTDKVAREAALLAAATSLVNSAGLTPAAVATVVAINKQPPGATTAPIAFTLLDALNFADVSNYSYRTLAGSLAQNTPDASNNVKYAERRVRAINGNVAKWGSGGDPTRGSDLHWDGTAWAACPINFENTATVRDAQGRSSYGYCGTRETGRSSRATIDVSGKTYLEVYTQIRDAGYTNLTVATAALGVAKFPDGSAVLYQTNTPLTNAIAYPPAGANSPAGTSQVVARYSAAVTAGGNVSTQPAGTGCNTFTVGANGQPTTTREIATNGSNSSTLEAMIAATTGTPCVFGSSMSFTYLGLPYTSTDPDAAWGVITLDLGTLGSAPVNSGPVAPGFYSGNTRLRVAFTGGNAVTYYSCKQRFTDGGTRACTVIGSGGTYTITTLGDARALSFNNLPAETGPLTYKRVYVERAGRVYYGYQPKPTVTNRARLNTVASNALLGQLGITADDPSLPMALTAGSYVGTWDIRASDEPVSPTIGTSLFINANGTVSCFDKDRNVSFVCSVNITDPATGAFTFVDADGAGTGTFNFLAGTVSGTYKNTTPPITVSFVGGRR